MGLPTVNNIDPSPERSNLVPGGFGQLMNPHGPLPFTSLYYQIKQTRIKEEPWYNPHSLHLTFHGEAPLPLVASGQWGRDRHGPHTGSRPCRPPWPPGWPAAVPALGVLWGKRKVLNKAGLLIGSSCPLFGTHRTPPALLGHCPALRPCFYQRTHTCRHRSSWRERSSVCHHASERHFQGFR